MPSTENPPAAARGPDRTAAGHHATASFTPRWPGVIALAVFVLAALTLCWPMLAGRFLIGDDMLTAGYGFRQFGAETLKQTGHLPEWNPYIFGGMPFIAAMHGDIFYPVTLLLRWALPLQTAMNLGFFLHIVLAGCTMYAFLRALRTTWTGAVVGGLVYEMSGIVTSMVNPGHDGKLYISALAPLAFLGLLRAIRDGRWWGYGLLALVVGLGMFVHYQMTYYLLVAAGIWTLWLVFFDPERRPGLRWPVTLAAALGAVGLGLAISAVQALPFLAYIPFSPRSAGGPSGGWEYATSFAMPVEEIMTTVLPQFNGMLEHYWGQNFFKAHTEYLGALTVLLAAFGLGDRTRGRLRWGLLTIGVLFLLVAFGGHTPFYRLWYEVMPMMKKVRAAGMAFYLPALVTAVFAGFGVERLQRGDVPAKSVLIGAGVLAALALLGVVGALQSVAEGLAQPQMTGQVAANAGELQAGALRLLVVVLAAGAVLWALATARLGGAAAAAALAVVAVGDLWSIDRLFFTFKPPASVLFADDALTTYMRRSPKPYRAWDPFGVYHGGQIQGGSMLMAYDIPQLLGYHGNELRYYDELLGGKGMWSNVQNPTLLDLTAVRFVILPQQHALPGFREVVPPTTAVTGNPAVLYERDSTTQWARVVTGAAKLADDQIVPTVIDPRFPYDRISLYPDSAPVTPAAIHAGALPPAATARAAVAEWRPGHMRITLEGREPAQSYLLVGENWYPDWHATVDGKPAAVLRADNTFLSVALPPGAKEVVFDFHSPLYDRGKLITAIAALLTLGLLASPLWRARRGPGAPVLP
ncbi:MAG TPA: YfhO family protein [Gemmatimonadales bacterium]|nr:YfhO family protein [Gemmatimonadales bacterium]